MLVHYLVSMLCSIKWLGWQGLGLQVVEDVSDADFVLAHGTEAMGLPSGGLRPLDTDRIYNILESCAAKRIPMVVANPDFVTVEARALRLMPGPSVNTSHESCLYTRDYY